MFSAACTVPLSFASAARAEGAEGRDAEAEAEAEERLAAGDFLSRFRRYIAVVRTLATAVDDATAESIQEFFVKRRAVDKTFEQGDLHRCITLAMLAAASHGEETLGPARWERTVALEAARRARAAAARRAGAAATEARSAAGAVLSRGQRAVAAAAARRNAGATAAPPAVEKKVSDGDASRDAMQLEDRRQI
jgi:hypothetical protein